MSAIPDEERTEYLNKMLFTTSTAKTAQKRVLSNRPGLLFPGINTIDPQTLRFKEELVNVLNEVAPANLDSEGLSGPNGVPTNFNRLRTIMPGTHMNPTTVPPVDNEQIRDDYGLAKDFITDRHRQIWDGVWDEMFRIYKPGPLTLAAKSSTLFPRFTSNLSYKKQLLRWTFSNLQKILDLVRRGKLEQAYKEYEFVIAYFLGKRDQPDNVLFEDGIYKSKPREVNDLEYALSGGQIGRRFIADKTVFDANGNAIKGHFASRRRTVYGLSACVNYVLASFFSGIRAAYSSKFEFTWKHRDAASILAKVKKYDHFMGADVKQHDQMIARWQLERFCAKFDKVFKPEIVDLMTLAFFAPYYSNDPHLDQPGGFWSGDPFNPLAFDNCYGLPSCISPNPDYGKYGMTSVYLCILDDYFGDVLEFGIDRILKGEHPHYALLNMGDDAVMCSNSDIFIKKMQKILDSGQSLSPYMVVEKEDSVTFLGNVFYRDDNNEIQLTPNICSYVVNWFAPEHGIETKAREFWPIGWEERNIFYSQAPSFNNVYTAMSDVFRRHFGSTPDQIVAESKRNITLPVMPYMSDVDRQVFLDPDKLYYRFSPDDVDPSLLDNLVHSVPAHVVLSYIEDWMI